MSRGLKGGGCKGQALSRAPPPQRVSPLFRVEAVEAKPTPGPAPPPVSGAGVGMGTSEGIRRRRGQRQKWDSIWSQTGEGVCSCVCV